MSIVKLKSSDGDIFDVEVEIAKKSVLIKEMIENLGMEDDDQEPCPLTNVTSPILRKVLEWATFHRDDPPPPPEECDTGEYQNPKICAWDMEFLKVDAGTLFELIKAADYLNIKGLLGVTCKTVANRIEGKTPKEMRKIFNIEDDFSPSEKQLEPVRKENKCCEEKEQVQKEKVSGVKKKSDCKMEMSGVKKKGH